MWKINLKVLNCHHCGSYIKMFGFSFISVICLIDIRPGCLDLIYFYYFFYTNPSYDEIHLYKLYH